MQEALAAAAELSALRTQARTLGAVDREHFIDGNVDVMVAGGPPVSNAIGDWHADVHYVGATVMRTTPSTHNASLVGTPLLVGARHLHHEYLQYSADGLPVHGFVLDGRLYWDPVFMPARCGMGVGGDDDSVSAPVSGAAASPAPPPLQRCLFGSLEVDAPSVDALRPRMHAEYAAAQATRVSASWPATGPSSPAALRHRSSSHRPGHQTITPGGGGTLSGADGNGGSGGRGLRSTTDGSLHTADVLLLDRVRRGLPDAAPWTFSTPPAPFDDGDRIAGDTQQRYDASMEHRGGTRGSGARSLYILPGESTGLRTVLAVRLKFSGTPDSAAGASQSVASALGAFLSTFWAGQSYRNMLPLFANNSQCVYELAGITAGSAAAAIPGNIATAAALAVASHPTPACAFNQSSVSARARMNNNTVIVCIQSSYVFSTVVGECTRSHTYLYIRRVYYSHPVHNTVVGECMRSQWRRCARC